MIDQPGIILATFDDPALHSLLKAQLEAQAYALAVALNDQEMLKLIAERNVLAVLIDLTAATPNGLDMMRMIRNTDAAIQCVVLVSADTPRPAAEEVYEYVPKPANVEHLVPIIIHAAQTTKLLRSRQDSDTMLAQRSEELIASLKALQEAQERLDRTSAAALLGQLAEGLRHELGNALTVIRLSMNLITHYREDPMRFAKHMDTLEHGVHSIERIAMALRDFPSAERKGGEQLDLAQIIRHAAGQSQQDYAIPATMMRLVLPESAPVRGGFFQLVRAFDALLDNAIEAILHTKPPMPQIEVTLSADGNRWKVTIQDNGAGLTAEALAHALEPGYTTKMDRGFMRGLGLGLFVANTIVDQHGGQMRLSNAPEGGTLVEVWLPQEPAASQS
jgi:two-component system C4-dicarboxylate transport sensor histidine kinase DctB